MDATLIVSETEIDSLVIPSESERLAVAYGEFRPADEPAFDAEEWMLIEALALGITVDDFRAVCRREAAATMSRLEDDQLPF